MLTQEEKRASWREKARRFRANHPNYFAEQMRQRRVAETSEQHAARLQGVRQYRRLHPERVNAAHYTWHAKHPEKQREYDERRRLTSRRAHAKTYEGRVKLLWKGARKRAKKTGLPIDEGVRATLIASAVRECPCCGIPLDFGVGPDHDRDKGPSLDRLDNSNGYVSGNVFVICRRCNGLKSDSTLEDLRRILAYMRHKEYAS